MDDFALGSLISSLGLLQPIAVDEYYCGVEDLLGPQSIAVGMCWNTMSVNNSLSARCAAPASFMLHT